MSDFDIGFVGSRNSASAKEGGQEERFRRGHKASYKSFFGQAHIIVFLAREQIDNSSIIANMQQRQKYGRDYDERQFKEVLEILRI